MTKKFRAYYKPDLDTQDGALKFVQKEINDDLFFVYDEDIWYPFQIPFLDDDWIVQQWTGLVDKNGVEIYEGDILKIINPEHTAADLIDYTTVPEESHIVYISQSNTGEYYGKNTVSSWYTLLDYPAKEIIGNIMENPELLQKK